VCLLDFYITQILTSATVLIECISRLIKVTILWFISLLEEILCNICDLL